MRRKTYRYEGEQRNGRVRKVISRKLGEYPHTKAGEARAAALAVIGQRARGESLTEVGADITVSQAWVRYEVYLKRENRSSRTISDYRHKFEKHLALWHGTPLRKITRAEVLTWHGKVTKDAGAYAANGFAHNHPREMGGQVNPSTSADSTRINVRGGSVVCLARSPMRRIAPRSGISPVL